MESAQIWTTFALECAHSTPAPLSDGRLHGHSYLVAIYYPTHKSALLSLASIQAAAALIREELDHTFLNDFFPVPTMEALADYIAESEHNPARPLQVTVERPSLGCGVIHVPPTIGGGR